MALDVKGMTIEDIRSLNTRGLSLSELRAVTTRLVSAANKRVRRMASDQYGRTSRVAADYAKAQAEGRKLFQTKGLDTRAKVKAEFDRARAFLDPSKKSHTIKGWKKVMEDVRDRMGVSMEALLDPDFWKMYRRFESDMVPGSYTSDSLIPLMSVGWAKGHQEDEDMKAWLRGDYEEREGEEQEDTIGDIEEEFGDYYD